MINIDTMLNRAHVYLQDFIEEKIEKDKSYIAYEKDFNKIQAFLFMNLSDADKLSEKYQDFYKENLTKYRTDKKFANCINICLKQLKNKYENESIRLKDDTIVEGKNHFDKIYERLNERVEENVM